MIGEPLSRRCAAQLSSSARKTTNPRRLPQVWSASYASQAPDQVNTWPKGISLERQHARMIRPVPVVLSGAHDRLIRVNRTSLEVQGQSSADASYIPISGRWLRDNCGCNQCRNPETGQRQMNVFKGVVNCDIARIETSKGGAMIHVTFGDEHQTTFTQEQLRLRSHSETHYKRHGIVQPTMWNAGIASDPPSVEFASVEKEGVGLLLQKIRVYGFCFVDGMPATPEATESLLTTIGPIRNTHYGGFYDFTSNLSSKDTAYTNESLEPHTDNTYFTEPTGLQALHLLSHTDGSGGQSSLVDGFGVAAQLYESDPKAYRFLSTYGVLGHASGNEGISIQPSHAVPVLSHHPRMGFLEQVRWNNADRAGIDGNFTAVEKWYSAAAKFDALISKPENQYVFQLQPGRPVIFDNWRCLHGRTAFTGKRRMCGGYINRDDFISKYRATNMTEEDIRASTVTG